ncbi:hypothetical protein ACMZ6Y_09520, partial [Streptococcus pluranimalium]
GGILMFNSQEKKREQNYKREQDRIVKYFVENYELSDGDTIKNIEFTEFEKIVETGYWHITILVNDAYYISFSETEFGKELDGSGYYSREIWYLKDKKKATDIENIKIKYIED